MYFHKIIPFYAFILAFIFALIIVPTVLAHSPVPGGDNEFFENALMITDPAKSWVVFQEIHEAGEARYYKFNISQGELIYSILQVSIASGEQGFVPNMVLMGPNIPDQGVVPDFVNVPEGYGAIVINSTMPDKATYEGFTPAVFYRLSSISMNATGTGTFYIAVYSSDMGGYFNIAIGYLEEFTLLEWLSIPYNAVLIYQWEGQSIFLILTPMLVTVVIGMALWVWRGSRAKLKTPFGIAGVLAGLLFLGSGATLICQILYTLQWAPLGPEIVITIMLALMPIILGIITLRIVANAGSSIGTRTRIYMVILGVLALFAWAGFYLGPALAILASVLPYQIKIARRQI